MAFETVKPTWIRLADDNNNYVGSLDPQRFMLMSVKRGGTAFFDLAEIIAEWRRTQEATAQGEMKGDVL